MTTAKRETQQRRGSGECYLCGKQISGHRYMATHLTSCINKWSREPDEDGDPTIYIHATISGDDHHWMEVAIHQDTTLRQLDQFLRNAWLECCDRLSTFRFGEMYIGCDEVEDDIRNSINDIDTGHLVNFDTPYIKAVLPSCTIKHEYDFGSTSETEITTQRYHELPETRPIVVIARNNPIEGEDINSPRWGYEYFDGQDLQPVDKWIRSIS